MGVVADELPVPTTAEILAPLRNPACELCPIHKEGAQTICMSGAGPLPARVALVGEAPGYNEDRQGVPFIGEAGQVLNRGLAEAGIDRSEVFVTNSVRCRPAQNRAPTLTEIKACKPYLDAELEHVQPEVIVLLGNSALKSVLKMSGITTKRGATIERDGKTYLPMLHPAYVLRDPTHLPTFNADMLALRRLLDGKTQAPITKVHQISTLPRLRRFLHLMTRIETPIAFDIETATTSGRKEGGVQPWAPDWRLDTVAFAWKPGVAWVIPLEHFEQHWGELVQPDAEDKEAAQSAAMEGIYGGLAAALHGKKLVGHNIKFDLSGLRARDVPCTAHFDTMVAAHLLDENRRVGLKTLARTLLGAELWEDEIKYDGTDSLEKLVPYNGRDADYTLRLYHIFRNELIGQPPLARIFVRLMMPAVNALVDIERRGFPVSLRRLRDRHLELGTKLAEAEEEFLAYVPEEHRAKANIRSVPFVSWLLYDHLRMPVLAVSAKTKNPSTAEEHLVILRDRHPVIDAILRYRGLHKLAGTYTRNWIDRIKLAEKARLYPSYKVTGTVTGRLSGDMQQIPRDPFVRSIITAPKGWRLVEADLSQIELRIAAMMSGDRSMSSAYMNGEDLHMLTATAITGKPPTAVSKEERSRAKPVNFGYLYGLGWKNFIPYARVQFDMVVSPAESQAWRNAFFNRYPALVFWHLRQRRLVQAQRYVESYIGRRRRLPAVDSSEKEVRETAERQAINSPVQSLASDLTLMALVVIHRRLDAKNAWIVGTVHDSLLIEVREDKADEVAAMAKEVMENLPTGPWFGWKSTLPIEADAKIYQSWSEAA